MTPMSSAPSAPPTRLSTALTVGFAVTFLLGVLLNLAEAITGDQGWPTRQPWSGVRLVVGVLFLVFALGRLGLWLAGRSAGRRSRT